jgi:hypothetical protein
VEAALEIANVGRREDTFESIALDAARAGDGEMVSRAWSEMRYVDRRDACAAQCAQLLASAGRSEAALNVAREIRSVELRDQIFQALALPERG